MSSTIDLILRVEKEVTEVLDSVNSNDIDKIASVINDCDSVVGFGAGRMGYMVRAFMMRLNHLGIKASFFGSDTYIPPMTNKSVMFAASGSGETKSVLDVVRLAYNKTAGCSIVALTGNKNSTLAKISDVYATFKPCNGGLNSADDDSKINSIQPMTTLNEQATLIILDIIALKIMTLRNMTTTDTKKYHFNVE